MTQITLDLYFQLESAFHIQAGFGASGLHQSLVRNHKGQPVIPASSIKGRLRYNAFRFGNLLQDHNPPSESWLDRSMSYLFGDENRAAHLYIGNGTLAAGIPQETPGNAYREIRSGNSLDRHIGSVSDGQLRFYEALPSGLRFETQIEAQLPNHHHPDEPSQRTSFQNSLALLLGAICLTDRLGAGKSRGSGSVRLVITAFRLRDGDGERVWNHQQQRRWLGDFLKHRLPGLEATP